MVDMVNRVIVVQVDSVLKYPPTIMLINNLVKLGKKVYLLSTYVGEDVKSVISKDVVCVEIGREYKYSKNAILKMMGLFGVRKKYGKKLIKYMITKR